MVLDERHLTYFQNTGNCSRGNTVPYPRVVPESTTNMLLYTGMLGSQVYLHLVSKNVKIKLCILCFVDRASLYTLVNISNLVHQLGGPWCGSNLTH